jgi:hypothetical protein
MKLTELSDRKTLIFEKEIASKIPGKPSLRQIPNGYMFVAGNDVFRFRVGRNGIDSMGEAKRMAEDLKDRWSLKGQRKNLRTEYKSAKIDPKLLPGNTKQRIAQIGQINKQAFPRTTAWRSSRTGRVFFRLLSAFMVEEILRNSILITMANIEAEFMEGEITEAEYVDKVEVAWGMYAIQITGIMLVFLKTGKNVTFVVKQIRNLVRAGQLAAGGTGVGTIPAIISALVTEAGFQLAIFALTNPKTQKFLVDYIVEWGQESLFGSMIQGGVEMAGQGLNAAAAGLNALTGGLVGSEDFFSASGAAEASGFVDPGAREIAGVDGSAYATSQWARLVFQDLIFPPGTSIESRKVPYYTRTRREIMMAEDFGALVNQQPELSSRLDTKGQIPKPSVS